MEGLIPLVYRALKKNRTRRQYKCLSSSSFVGAHTCNNFYDSYQLSTSPPHRHQPPPPVGAASRGHLRRLNSSLGDYYYTNGNEYFSREEEEEEEEEKMMKAKKLVRFGSHRIFFSCVSGGA